MTHILTLLIEENGEIAPVLSAGLSDQLALTALEAVEREMRTRVIRAELEAQLAQAAKEADDDQP